MLCHLLLSLAQTDPQLENYRFGEPGDGFGAALAMVGDWDNDGVEDYAVGAPRDDVDSVFLSVEDHGQITVFSGSSGDQLGETGVFLPESALLGATLVGGFDTDQDGLPEFAASAPGLGQVLILEKIAPSIPAILVIATISAENTGGIDEQGFGATLANVGDLTGDGIDDLAIGSPDSDRLPTPFSVVEDAGAVRLVSGATWTTVNRWSFGDEGARFGSAIDDVLDLNGNGGRDLAVGAPGVVDGVSPTAGRVYFLDRKLLFGSPVVEELVASEVGTGFGAGLREAGNLGGGPGSELLIASVDVEPKPYAFGVALTTELAVERGSLALYDLDLLQANWEQGGDGTVRLDGRGMAIGDPDGDGGLEAVLVEASSDDRGASIVTVNLNNGGIESRFDAAAGLGLDSTPAVIVGPEFNGDGREEIVFGTPRLEFEGGGTFGVSIPSVPTAFGPTQWRVDAAGGADFDGVSQAAMVARAGDRIEVEPGTYDFLGIGKPLTVFGVGALPVDIRGIDIRGATRALIEALDVSLLRIVGNTGRVMVSDVRALQATVAICAGVTFIDTAVGPAAPGLDIVQSTVEFVASSAQGGQLTTVADLPSPVGIRVLDSLLVAADSDIRGADALQLQSDYFEPREAVRLIQSNLDLRTNSSSVCLGGIDPNAPSLDASDVVVSSGNLTASGPAIPSDVVTVGASVFAVDAVARPWITHPTAAALGGSWAVTTRAHVGAAAFLYHSLAPDKTILPVVQGVPVWIDPALVIDTQAFIGLGPDVPLLDIFVVPANPALAGLELHLQAFVQRPDIPFFDGTNGGVIQLRP